MKEATYYTQSNEILCSLTGKTRVIVQWLLSETVQSVINARDLNWKLVVSGGAKRDIRTVIEQHQQILSRS